MGTEYLRNIFQGSLSGRLQTDIMYTDTIQEITQEACIMLDTYNEPHYKDKL